MTRDINVLHVEDDFADAMLFQHALQDAGALHVDMEVARTLRDARLKLGRKRFDLIIADLRLPDSRDPNDTVTHLERHANDTPILVLTGSAGVDAERLKPRITVLDKNAFFHNRDDRKSRALFSKVLEAAKPEPSAAPPASIRHEDGEEDGDDTLML
ncbi:MAG: response regulator [Oceanicaulis sp.]